MAAVLALLSAWGIWTAVGIFRQRGWARISMVVFATLLTFIGLCAALAISVMPMPVPPQGGVSHGTLTAIRLGIATFYGLLAAIGVWWLVLFNLKSAKEYFAPDAYPNPYARPLSVSVIGWYLLFGAFCLAVTAAIRLPAVLFGAVFTGWAAVSVYAVFAATQLMLGTGLLNLKEPARIAGIAYFCFAALNSALILTPPGLAAKMRIMQSEMPRLFPAGMPMTMPQSAWMLVLMGIAVAAVPIWFLVQRRGAFLEL